MYHVVLVIILYFYQKHYQIKGIHDVVPDIGSEFRSQKGLNLAGKVLDCWTAKKEKKGCELSELMADGGECDRAASNTSFQGEGR